MKIEKFKKMVGYAMVWALFWGLLWGLLESDAIILSSLHDLSSWPFLSWVAIAMVMFWGFLLMVLIYGALSWFLGILMAWGKLENFNEMNWMSWLSGVGMSVIICSIVIERFRTVLGVVGFVALILFALSLIYVFGFIVRLTFKKLKTMNKKLFEKGVGVLSLLIVSLSAGVLLFLVSQAGARFAKGPVGWSLGDVGEKNNLNIVLLTVDAWRGDSFNEEDTPRLYKLAEEKGVVFNRAYSPAPWTFPSFASMMTGLYPGQLGISTDDLGIEEIKYQGRITLEVESIAERLKSEEYTTQAVLSNEWLSEERGMTQGFDGVVQLAVQRPYHWEFHAYNMSLLNLLERLPLLGEVVNPMWEFMVGEVGPGKLTTDAVQVSQIGIDWLKKVPAEPFFLWLHYMDPHNPYNPPSDYQPVVDEKEAYRLEVLRGTSAHEEGNIRWREVDRKMFKDLYDGEVRYIDKEVSRLITKIEDLGYGDNTLIVVTADHGEEFWEHGGLGHGRTMYDESVNVPLIIFGLNEEPEIKDEVVSLVDLKPNIINWTDGGNEWVTEDKIWIEGNGRGGYLKAVIDGRWKIVKNLFSQEVELYDLFFDPKERHDVGGIYPVIKNGLLGEIDEQVEENDKFKDKLEKHYQEVNLGDVVGY